MVTLVLNSLFPEADEKECSLTKRSLTQYKKMRAVVEDFERNYGHQHQKRVYEQAKETVKNIDRAINLILDEEVRRIIQFRFTENGRGNSHKLTVLRFSGSMGDRTVDRKIIEGIESVANTLKLWGELE
ncbi:hypothetical protein [Paenibacillus koleovorans]|uniref:hypothetical protein n=1 Tax=Paenibacillus koleovorans TaxID=121608 RepID=UPI000FD8BA2A|nr:hypothetical protein [Paenibacillus koleovorans]